jgi:membrane-anchored protein YejM (alkaline phosphatase superfamily)
MEKIAVLKLLSIVFCILGLIFLLLDEYLFSIISYQIQVIILTYLLNKKN